MKFSLAGILPHLGRHGRAARWKRTKLRPRIWAHRGDSAHHPENTLVAFEAARTKGADGLEIDVRLDGDDNVVVFHDSPLERLCGVPGTMETTSAAQRAKLRVRGEPIPLLADVLAEFDFEIDVEIKATKPGREGKLVAAVAKVLAAHKRENILASSFDPISLVQLHRHLPDIALGFIFDAGQPYPFRKGWIATAMGASLVHPEHTLCTEASVAAWHTAGMPINTFTVDDPNELRRLATLGVDGVFTNDVATAVRVFSE